MQRATTHANGLLIKAKLEKVRVGIRRSAWARQASLFFFSFFFKKAYLLLGHYHLYIYISNRTLEIHI
jgi:hypothetical protein